jgi:multidrug efflux pump
MELAVRAETIDGVQPPDVTNALLPKLKPIVDTLPSGYRIDTGGAVEESGKANASIFKLFPLMFALMLTVLMVQLQSFSRLFLVFLTAPLGIIGASLALNITDRPFGFVALLGLIALAGMIMRNTVILVDQIEADVAAGRRPCHGNLGRLAEREQDGFAHAAVAVLQVSNAAPLRMRSVVRDVR